MRKMESLGACTLVGRESLTETLESDRTDIQTRPPDVYFARRHSKASGYRPPQGPRGCRSGSHHKHLIHFRNTIPSDDSGASCNIVHLAHIILVLLIAKYSDNYLRSAGRMPTPQRARRPRYE